MLSTGLLVLALVALIVAALPLTVPNVNIGWLGLALAIAAELAVRGGK